MTQRALGYTYKHALKREAALGVNPGGNFVKVPIYDCNLGPNRKKLTDKRAGQGRDPQIVYDDVTDVAGSIKVPLDPRYIGYWLTGLLGDANTPGAGPNYTHTFASGASTLPSYAQERQHTGPVAYDLALGCFVDSMQFVQPNNGGPAMATVNVLGMSWTPNTATQAGTLTTQTDSFMSNLNGQVTLGGNPLADVTSFDFIYANNLVTDRDSNSAGLLSSIVPGEASLTGKLTSRFLNTTLRDDAWAGTACALSLVYTITANLKLSLIMPEVYLEPTKEAVNGPGGYSQDFTFIGKYNTVATNMFSAVLINDLAGAIYA